MSLTENLAKLNADVADLIDDAATVQADLDAIAAEIPKLQASPHGADIAADLSAVNWQRLICTAIPIYNMVAGLSGWPVMPLPAFCSNVAQADSGTD